MVVREQYYQQGQGAVGNACGKLLMGTLLFFLSVVGLWFNEGAAVQTAMSLDEVHEAHVSPTRQTPHSVVRELAFVQCIPCG